MSKTKAVIIAAVAAVIVEAALLGLLNHFGYVGWGAVNGIALIVLLFHLPATIISEALHLPQYSARIVWIATGGFQWFLLFWLALFLCNHRRTVK